MPQFSCMSLPPCCTPFPGRSARASKNAQCPSEAKSLGSGVRRELALYQGACPARAVLPARQRLAEHSLLPPPERSAVADDEHASLRVPRSDRKQGARDSV